MAITVAAETRNDAASRPNAHPVPSSAHQEAADGGSGEAQGHRTDQLVQRVGLGQQVRRQQLGHEGIGRRVEEGGRGSVHDGDGDELRERQRSGDRQSGQRRQQGRPHGVGGEHDPAAVVPVR